MSMPAMYPVTDDALADAHVIVAVTANVPLVARLFGMVALGVK
jgi:hypothetical protein